MKRWRAVAAVIGATVVLGGGTVGALTLIAEPAGSHVADASRSLRPVQVERASLAQGTVLSGSLSRGAPVPLDGSGEGVLTWLPAPGSKLVPGDRVWESNGRPTFFLRGEVPLWRPLEFSSRGKDVLALNRALADAGFLDESLADEVFGAGTSAALASLYARAGYPAPSESDEGQRRIAEAESALDKAKDALAAAEAADSSSGEEGDENDRAEAVAEARAQVADAERDVVVARAEWIGPSDIRILDTPKLLVSTVVARVGDLASGPVVEWTGATVHARASVTRSQQASLTVGDEVKVSLPDGSRAEGKIASTGSSMPGAASDEEGAVPDDGQGEVGADLVTVWVTVEGQRAVAGLVGAEVQMEVTSASVEDALVVPVTALVALAEGGYAVEKVTADSPPGTGELVPVDVGLVAEARAQISSAEIHAGDEVLVP